MESKEEQKNYSTQEDGKLQGKQAMQDRKKERQSEP
jgi:hypothetical protein